MVVNAPPRLLIWWLKFHQSCKVVALFAITLLFWWHFPPPLLHFDGTFCLHTFSALICVRALSAPTLQFWWHFLPPFSCFGGAFCPHTGFTYSIVSFTITSASDITFSAISTPSSGNPFVSDGISTSSCSLITESPTAAS